MPGTHRNPPRVRRSRADIREELLEAALVEFGAKGFDGASTRAIARRIEAHQPQINYHFASKEALWAAAVDHLFALLARSMADLPLRSPGAIAEADPEDLAEVFAEMVRRFVRFAAEHPELNQIVVHEATTASERLTWMTKHHLQPIFDAVQAVWQRLRDAGIAAPIDDATVPYYALVGAASLPYVTAPAARLLIGAEPTEPTWIEAHAAGLVTLLLPGYG